MYQYAFQGMSGAISNPALGQYQFSGQIGTREFHVIMSTERSLIEVAADGAPIGATMAGRNGVVEIVTLQNSSLHAWLENLFNSLEQSALNGNVLNWYATSMTIIDQLSGRTHVCTGGGITKIPDQPYAAAPQNVTWRILFGDIATTVPVPA